MKIELIRSNSAPERVVKQILANLESSNMKRGQKLPTQEQLAEKFGVGRSSIREATNALAIMGYIKIFQGKGTYIAEELPTDNIQESSHKNFFSDADLFNLVEIREVLECHVVQKASKRADSSQLSILNKAILRLEECVEGKSNFLAEDLNFHIAIANAANLPEVGKLIKVIHTEINRLLSVFMVTTKSDAMTKSIQSAKMVYHHIVSGEPNQATRSMRNHLSTYADALKKAAQSRE